jgi:hypothetical protein
LINDNAKKEISALAEGINDVKAELKDEFRLGLNESRNEARKESYVLQDMMSQMIKHINNNNSTSQTPVTSTEKRKHDAKTTSINPEEEMASPDHRKRKTA